MQRLLPPRLFFLSLATMLGLHHMLTAFWSGLIVIPPVVGLTGAGVGVAGLIIVFAGAAQFRRRRTNIRTFNRPDELVEDGLFRYSRNPMYLGFCLALAGLALWLGSVPALAVALAYFIICNRWYIAFEEQMMLATFGDAYRAYCRRTRRWL